MPANDRLRAREFSGEELKRMLSLLDRELAQAGITGEICIVGGAAMILGFGSRKSTRDIDALVIAPTSIRDAARKVAEANGFADDWLNDGVKGFASGGPVEIREILQLSHLRVVTPPPEYILAMKCMAARVGIDEHDKEDAAFLIRHLGLTTPEEVMDIVGRYYDRQRIPAKTQYFVQEVCHELLT
jgi:hypothetical protein